MNRTEIENCTRCELHKTRNKVVIGRGSKTPKILFIGEAPGPMEDEAGIPFVGKAGHLLNKWIDYLGLERGDYAMINVVKCFPNKNGKIRPPLLKEIKACTPFTIKQIEELKPKHIVILGRIAMEFIIPALKGSSITKVAGQRIASEFNENTWILLHPAFFLRNLHSDWRPQLKDLYKGLTGQETPAPMVISEDSKLVYDLETSSFDTTGRIKLFGWYSYKTKSYGYTSDLKEMQRVLDGHYYLIGYNTIGFDNPYLDAKSINVRGKAVDLLKVVQARAPNMTMKFDSFSLNAVCEKLGIETKKDISLEVLLKDKNTKEETDEIIAYNKQDVKITKELFEKLDGMFSPMKEYLPREDQINMGHLLLSSGSYAYKVICHKAGLPEEYSYETDTEKIEGGFVLEPKKDKYIGYVYRLDFSSAYPHAFMESNLYTKADSGKCDCVAGCKHTYNGNEFFKLRGTYCIAKPGKIESVIKELYNKRLEYKKTKDRRQYAIKILINTIYGISGSSKFSSVYDIDTANDCTAIVRKEIKFVIKTFKLNGYDVIYADTDSCFIHVPIRTDKTNADIERIKNEIIEEIKKYVPFPQDTFDLSYETGLKALFFSKGDDKKFNKKHYVYVTENDTIGEKGIAIVKRNSTLLSKKVYERLKPLIIKDLKCRYKLTYIKELVNEELKKDIKVAATTFRVKDCDAYKNQNSIQYQIAYALGPGKHKLIRNKKIGIGRGVKYCTLEEMDTLTIDDLDLTVVMSELNPFIIEPKIIGLEGYF